MLRNMLVLWFATRLHHALQYDYIILHNTLTSHFATRLFHALQHACITLNTPTSRFSARLCGALQSTYFKLHHTLHVMLLNALKSRFSTSITKRLHDAPQNTQHALKHFSAYMRDASQHAYDTHHASQQALQHSYMTLCITLVSCFAAHLCHALQNAFQYAYIMLHNTLTSHFSTHLCQASVPAYVALYKVLTSSFTTRFTSRFSTH